MRIGELPSGPHDAITDVDGVRVGHSTIVRGEGPLVVGEGPVRTGVTVVCPRKGLARDEPVFAGAHRFNGNGEMTGLEWIREAGILATPVGITNTHSVGVVRDALVKTEMEARTDEIDHWCLPVVAETYDGTLNDINGQHVTAEHLREALASASTGPVTGGLRRRGDGYDLPRVQGRHRHGLAPAPRRRGRLDGRCPRAGQLRAPLDAARRRRACGPCSEHGGGSFTLRGRGGTQPAGTGSIIVVLATDAPLLPTGCDRLAKRASIGLGRMGGGLDNGSGDIFLAFATGNEGIPRAGQQRPPATVPLQMVSNRYMTPLFHAAAEATEAAILNALLAAGDMTGRDGITAHGLTPESLLGALEEARKTRR